MISPLSTVLMLPASSIPSPAQEAGRLAQCGYYIALMRTPAYDLAD